jgi:cytochrome c oxidase assembly protein subunit 15
VSALAKTSLLLVIVLVSLSAYLRLAHSGIGCADWPACYGQIGELPSVSQPVSPQDAYQRMGEAANKPMAWATPLHRLVASVLGLLVFFLVFFSLRQKRQRLISLALLALTVFLAVLGIRSGSLHNPAVVMGNLAGGFAMLGLLGWMVFSTEDTAPASGRHTTVNSLVIVAIAVLCLQILLGGLTSANFAATSCQTLPDCHGSWLPGGALMDAIDLSRQHEVTSMGQAIGGEERIAIHKAHRLGALFAFSVVLIAAVAAIRADSRYRPIGIIILVLLTVEFAVGVTAVLSSLPIGLAVAHNWLAGLLLLALLKLLALSRF